MDCEERQSHRQSLDCEEHESHHQSLDCEERQSHSQSLDDEECESHRQLLDCEERQSHSQSLDYEERQSHSQSLDDEECESHRQSLDCEERQSHSQSLDDEERESHRQSLDCVVRESQCQYVTLCEVHYKQLHRKLHQNDNTYVRQKCKLCNKAIKQVRHIAMPAHVNSIYSGISDSIALRPHDPVCLTCYKAHMSLSEDDISTDKDLIEISQSIKQMSVDNDNLSEFEKHIALALINVFSHVCIILLDSSATLVKNVYHTFVQKSIEFAESYGLGTLSVNDIKATFSQKNLITQLVIIFHKHIVFLTKAKKMGTVIHRSGADLAYTLSRVLHKQGTDIIGNQPKNHSIDSVAECINKKIHDQIDQNLTSNIYNLEDFNIDHWISTIDPELWKFMTTLVQPVKKRNDIQSQRKVQIFYCLCVLLFVCDHRCSLPLHVLLTDVIDAYSGSYELIQVFNRIGAVASVETHKRHVQHVVGQTMSKGPLSQLNLELFTIASVDNIDFSQSHAYVYSGSQARSWHGTTIQVVQPSLFSQSLKKFNIEGQSSQHELPHSASPNTQGLPLESLGKRVTRPTHSPSPMKSITSPTTKRARTLSEAHKQKETHTKSKKKLSFELSDSASILLNQISVNHYSNLRGQSIDSFKLNPGEEGIMQVMGEAAFTYVALRLVY